MRYKIGDKVKFLNDIGGGVITGLKGSDMVLVLGDNGFEIPVMIFDLVLDNPNDVFFTKEETPSFADDEEIDIDKLRESVRKELAEDDFDVFAFKEQYQKENIEAVIKVPKKEGLYLAVSKVSAEKINIYFINDSSHYVLYHFATEINPNQVQLLEAGMCDKGEKELIGEFDREFFNENRSFFVQLLCFKDHKYNKKEPIVQTVTVKSIQVARGNGFSANEYLDSDTLLIKLDKDQSLEEALDKLSQNEIRKQAGEYKPKPIVIKKNTKNPDIEEIDLHIEEIIDNHEGLSNREILDIQMARFETTLTGAINGTTKRIVFIHGIGNGRLKMEVRNMLDKKYFLYKYQDASFEEYGYGATMVMLR